MKINPADAVFNEIGTYDSDCCETCRQANGIIARWRERVNREQAASCFGTMDPEKMTVKIEITCEAVVDEQRVATHMQVSINKPDDGEMLSERKQEVIQNILADLNVRATKLWATAFLCNDAVNSVDAFLEELDAGPEGTDAQQSQHLN